MRAFLLTVMVASFFGLGVYDLVKHNWQTGIASVLLGVVQTLVFWKGQ